MLLFSTGDAPFLGWVVTTDIVIYAIAAGVFLSFVAFWFVQNVVGSLVRELLKSSTSEKNGKTLDELGKNNAIYRFLLREGKVLRRTVSVVGGELAVIEDKKPENEANAQDSDESSENGEKPKKGLFKRLICWFKSKFKRVKYDYTEAKFYIGEEQIEGAEAKYSKTFKTWLLPIILVLCAAVAFGMTFLMPIIMDFIR